jgi:hypothetical protein
MFEGTYLMFNIKSVLTNPSKLRIHSCKAWLKAVESKLACYFKTANAV